MNPPISKKLLFLLGVTLVAGAFGVRSLLSVSGGATESGFDGPPPLPLSGAIEDRVPPLDFSAPQDPRNPFALLEPDLVDTDPVEADPDDEGALSDGDVSDPDRSS